jgi:adenosine deaminase
MDAAGEDLPALDRAAFVALPKAQLHLHLEAAMRPATARTLATQYGLPLPSSGPYAGLKGFVEDYEAARDLLGSLDDVSRVASEVVQDAAEQGVVWTEVHCVPFNYGGRLGPPEDVVEAVLDGLCAGARQAGVGAALILAHNRAFAPALAWRTLEIARRFAGPDIVGFGLVGNEADFPPPPYTDVFAAARAEGLLSVPHAGEAAGPDSIRAAWQDLKADRICHGVRAVEDPSLLIELAAAGVCLDVCPTSNAMLRACPSLAEHQLPALVAAGVRVSLASDGPLFFGADIADEYLTAHTVLGMTPTQLAAIARDSLRASTASDNLRTCALAAIEAWKNDKAITSPT